MTADCSFESIRHNLARCGQEHLLAFWDELNGPERDHLVAQIGDLDLSSIPAWVETLVRNQPEAPIQPHDFQPARSYSPDGWSRNDHSRSKRSARWAARARTPKVSVA